MIEFDDSEEEGAQDINPATVLMQQYLRSVPVKAGAAERRRAWAVFLHAVQCGFPGTRQSLQAIDDLVRYLEGGYTGPRDPDE
jgi:hypothetical protein